MTTTVKNAGYLLQSDNASTNVRAVGDGVAIPYNPWFRYHACDGWSLAKGLHEFGENQPVWPPTPDWATWDGVQTVAQFLNAIDEFPMWGPMSGDDSIPSYAQRPAWLYAGGVEVFRCIVADWMLPYVSGQAWLGQKLRRRQLPPVWPGLDFVLLGDPVSIDTGVTITGPMDGVIVELGEVPPERDYYSFDSQLSYAHIGALAFADDNGAVEGFQPFSFGKHILTPTRLWQADACYLRADPFIVGTVTPWTVVLTGS